MVGRSSATRWDATTSQCEWRQGSRMGTWGGGTMRWYVRTCRQKWGKWEERCQETRGGGVLRGGGSSSQDRLHVERTRGRGSVLKGREAAAAQQQGWHDNQLRWIVERTRSGSSMMRGVVTISQRHQRTIGGGVLKVHPPPQNNDRWRMRGKRRREWGGAS